MARQPSVTMPPPQPGAVTTPTRSPFPATSPTGVSRIARTDTGSLGTTAGYPTQQPTTVPARRAGTGTSVQATIPTRAPARVAGTTTVPTTSPTVPLSRTARVAAGGTTDPSSAMAPARSSSRSVSTAGVEAAPTPRAVLRARRVSKIIVEKEKKTDYWQDIIQAAKAEYDLSQDDVNSIIARAMALDVVGNWKQRESNGAGMLNLALPLIEP